MRGRGVVVLACLISKRSCGANPTPASKTLMFNTQELNIINKGMKYKHYLIYKITNTVTGKIYIGAHRTNNPQDRYMGSGVALRNSIKKYGRQFFKKEILASFNTPEEMYEAEAVIVNEDFVTRKDTYNVIVGGANTLWTESTDEERTNWAKLGRRRANATGAHVKGSKKHHLLLQTDPEYAINYWKAVAEGRIGSNCGFAGQRHTEESKQKISKANSVTHRGTGNPNFGKKWMYNPDTKESKPIPKNQVKQLLTSGWKLGRISK